jgi:phytoene dehydrogenase-like protein
VVCTLGAVRTVELLADAAPALRASAAGLHSGHFNISELTVTLVLDHRVDLALGDPDAVWYAVADPDDVRRGFAEILAGGLPSSPWSMVAQVAQPDDVDGSAVWMSSVVPLRPADGPWTEERERAAAERLIDHVGALVGVDLHAGLVDVVVSGPLTWARRIGGNGNPNHIDQTIDQLLGWRTPGHGDMRSELDWLFLAGAGQHPGGGLSGASGSAAARAVLTPRGRRGGVVGRINGEARGLLQGARAYLAMRRT